MVKKRKSATKRSKVRSRKAPFLGGKGAWQRFWDHYCQM